MAQLALFSLLLLTIVIISSASLTGKNDTLDDIRFHHEDDKEEEKIRLAHSVDTCLNIFCLNGGSFVLENCEAKCKCPPSYTGEKCEIGPCTVNPCQNNGICTVIDGKANCACMIPYTGRFCEKDPCTNNPCKYNGTCEVIDGKANCTCMPPLHGEFCDKGCFHGSSIVLTRNGEKLMKDVRIGDEIASGFHPDGSLTFSPVMIFIHRDANVGSSYLKLKTDSNSTLLVTTNHLVFRSIDLQNFEAVHADKLQIGDFVYTISEKRLASKSIITNIDSYNMTGVFSPLTIDGTVIVNNILASCYPEADGHFQAHVAFLPLRIYHYIVNMFNSLDLSKNLLINEDKQSHQPSIDTDKSKIIQSLEFQGIHWYVEMLCWLTNSKCK